MCVPIDDDTSRLFRTQRLLIDFYTSCRHVKLETENNQSIKAETKQ